MKIELKNFKFYERMSEETNAFISDVWVNGVKVAYAKNDGHGGNTFIGSFEGMDKLLAEAEKYCLSLPPVKYEELEWKMTLEHFIDNLVTEKIKEQERKKLERRMETCLMWGLPKGNLYTRVKLKEPISQMLANPIRKKDLQAMIDHYRKDLKPGEIFLNTNIPEEMLRNKKESA